MYPNKSKIVFNSNFLAHAVICVVLFIYALSYLLDLRDQFRYIILLLCGLLSTVLVLRYKFLLFYLLVFSIPFSWPYPVTNGSNMNVPSEWMCLLLAGFLVVKILMNQQISIKLLAHPITILILMDLFWLFISSCFSQMPEISFKRLFVRLSYYICFYYYAWELFNLSSNNIRRTYMAYVIGFLIPITYTLFRHASYNFGAVGSQRLSSPFYYDHTMYGACLIFFVPYLYFRFLHEKVKIKKQAIAVLGLLFLLAGFLSYSRAAWLSLLIAVLAYLILKYKVKFRYVLLFCLIGFVAISLNWQQIRTTLEKNKVESHSNDVVKHFSSISNIKTDVSNKERINRWKCAVRMFSDRPLMGFGPGTYQFFYGKYQQHEDLTRISTFKGDAGHAHSEYLNYLSETGCIGLLIFLSLCACVLYKLVRLYKCSTEREVRITCAFIFMGLITYFFHGFFNGFLEFDKMAMPVFVSFAAVTFLDLRSKQSPQPPATF